MFDFQRSASNAEVWHAAVAGQQDEFAASLLAERPGQVVEGGLYRIHQESTGNLCLAAVKVAFPEHLGGINLIGYDWLGRQFGLDRSRERNGQALMVMFDLGGGEVLYPPLTAQEFHESLDDIAEPAFALDFFRRWVAEDPSRAPLSNDRCAGYVIPLFLRGNDDLDNLELTDLDVYLSLTAQLRAQARRLPVGTKISEIDIAK